MLEKTNEAPKSVGKILRVDLSKGQWIREEIEAEVIRMFIAGMGLALKILFEETGPQVEPLSPENIIIVSAGLLNGTDAPTAYRAEVTNKSPLTGIIGSGNFGGLFGSKLKRAGYEAVVLKGKSRSPVYLIIDDDQIELKSASHLWGKDTWDTTDMIKEERGDDFSVMAIGQAGENLVRFACPIVDKYHAPGRSHAGCVMGGKNLKAIAVRGTKKIPIAFPEVFKEASREIEERIRNFPEKGIRQEIGSTHKVADAAKRGRLGAKNYQSGILTEGNELLNPEGLTAYLVQGPIFCGNCLQGACYGCNTTIDVRDGKYAGLYMEGAGFSHPVFNWGGKCGIGSFPGMLKCKEVCNRYGMDQSGPIPFALELFQRGIITKEDLGGNELRWGDVDAIIEMLSKIAHRQGFGDILADGSRKAAERIGKGAGKYALTIKGMDIFSGADPRAAGISRNLGHMTCVRGGDDLKSTHVVEENIPGWVKKQGIKEEEYVRWFLTTLDMFDEVKEKIYGVPANLDIAARPPESIALMTKWYEDMMAVGNALGVCLFGINVTSAIGIDLSTKLFSAFLGVDYSSREMIKAGERIVNLMKAYNVREGLTRSDDDLPERFYSEHLESGPSKGKPLSKEYFRRLLDAYYDLRGWDRKTGNPTRNKLGELGLGIVADELVSAGLI